MSLTLLFFRGGGGTPTVPGSQLISIREKPPLRLHVDVESPGGRHTRWGADEPTPEHVVSGLRFSSTMPGGFESADGVLPRKTGRDAPDLESLSTVTVLGAGGDTAWQGRLERSPRTSGNEFSISPSAVGYQAILDDNKSARALIIDRDLSKWGPPDIERRLVLNANFAVTDPSSGPNAGIPTVRTSFQGPWVLTPGRPISEAWYDAQGLEIGFLVYAWSRFTASIVASDANWTWLAAITTTSSGASADTSGNLRSAGPGSGSVTPTAVRKFAYLQLQYGNVAAGGPVDYAIDWIPAVIGNHGLTVQDAGGCYASDIVDYIVGQFAPELQREIEPTSFVVDQFAEVDMTTASDLLTKANRFDLYDWAVWEDKTFFYFPRNSQGRKYRARVAPAQLSETGPQVDRIFSSVLLTYSDTDGSTKTVGPPGSGADTEDPLLQDDDPENPANKLGITRRQLLTMGTATAAGAIQIGYRYLQEQKLVDTSGQAQLVGHVTDDHGVLHAVSKVRAGDTLTLVDSHDNSERRIVRSDYDHNSRTCTVDLDSPSEGLQALLERLGVALVPLGLGS